MKLCILSLSLFLSFSSIAQIRYEEGYFIDNNNTKTTCLIRHVDWLNTPSEFNYKLNTDGEVMTAGLSGVKEFGVSGVKFIYARVAIDTSRQDLKNLSLNRHPEWSKRQLFLKVIVDGKADLYSYRSPDLSKFFYSVDSSSIEQLTYKQFLQGTNDIKTNQTYLQQLKNHVSCGDISDARLKKVRYDQSSLERYFIDFNICHGGKVAERSTKHIVHFSVTPGIDFSRFGIVNDNGFKMEYNKGTTFRLGVTGEYVLPFNSGKWAIVVEPTYQSYKSGIDVEYTSIEFPMGPRHNFFLDKNSRLFVNALLITDIPINYEVKWSQARTYKAKLLSLSFGGGLGFSHKKFSIEARQYFSRSILDDSNSLFFVYKKFSLILGYKING